ncbi:MAG: hypothetical protein DRP85_06435 [Candidatus Makaraimicrobium thalassicum]|nr:MAG: hypothetical protein DRP85_06435 [Candidatus Omnitrophota bacterium]
MISDQELTSALRPLIDDAKRLQEQLSPEREKFNSIYNADPYGNERPGWATTVAPVAFDTVEWIKPFLGDIFNGDFFTIDGNDDVATQQLKEYIRFKLWTQGHIDEQIDDFVHYSLTSHYGVFKITHQDNFHFENQEIEQLNEAQFQALSGAEELEVTKYDEVPEQNPLDGTTVMNYENIKVRQRIQDYKGPVVECVPPTEFYMSAGYAKLENCPLVAHVPKRTLDYIKTKERDGIYKKGSYEAVKAKIASRFDNPETSGEIAALFEASGLEVPSEITYADDMVIANADVEIWECYVEMDIDGDGYLESAIVVMCEDVVLQDPVENEYMTAPFELGVVMKKPHEMLGYNFCSIMEDWQRVATNLQRGIQDASLISTKRGWLTTDVPTQNALRKWVPGDTARVDKLGNVEPIDFGAPNQFMFKAYDQVSGEIDRHSGVSEAAQGLDRQAANKTAAAMEMKLTVTQQRQRLYALRLSRTFEKVLRRVLDIFRNHTPEDGQRAVGGDVFIDKIDFRGEYFFKIDVGVGVNENQQKAQIMDQHIRFMTEVGIQMGIGDPTHIIRATDKKAAFLNMDMSDLHYSEEEFNQKQQQQQQEQEQQKQQVMQFVQQLLSQGAPPEAIQKELEQKGIPPEAAQQLIQGVMNGEQGQAGPSNQGPMAQGGQPPGGGGQPAPAGPASGGSAAPQVG